jgi:hypothetical protein
MRTSMKTALGLVGAVDPLAALYDAILATNPTVPLLFRLTEYRGQQVLFQDAAATVPVTTVGDPIGAVCHPVTGEILMTQSTDGNRPVWGGVNVGAAALADNAFLQAPQISTNLNFIIYTGIFSVAAGVRFNRDGSNDVQDIGGTSDGGNQSGIYCRRDSLTGSGLDHAARGFWVRRNPFSLRVITLPNGSLPTNIWSNVLSVGNGSSYTLSVNGISDSITIFPDPESEPITRRLTIGRNASATGRSMDGDIKHFLIWDRELTSDEIEITEALL